MWTVSLVSFKHNRNILRKLGLLTSYSRVRQGHSMKLTVQEMSMKRIMPKRLYISNLLLVNYIHINLICQSHLMLTKTKLIESVSTTRKMDNP